MSPEKIARTLALQGRPQSAIAAALGISQAHASRIMRRAGVSAKMPTTYRNAANAIQALIRELRASEEHGAALFWESALRAIPVAPQDNPTPTEHD